MKTIRGGNGLGDALYVQSIARHLVNKGERLEVCTSWPDIFRPLGDKVVTGPFRRNSVDIVAHYVQGKQERDTTQFEDACMKAGIPDPVELRIDWQKTSSPVKSDKPIIVVGLPRQPMNRKDGYGIELLPDCRVIQRAIDRLKGRVTLVQVGAGEPLYRFEGIDINLANATSVCGLLDVAASADGFLGYCSFLIPLAESFSKPLLCVWSQEGLRSPHLFIRLVRPKKLLHRQSSKFVMDNCSDVELLAAVNELFEQARSQKVLRG